MSFCQLNSLHITIAVSMVKLSIWVTEWLGSSSGTTGPPSTSQSAHIILCPHIKLMQTSRLYSPCVCVCVCACVCMHACMRSVVCDSSQPHGLYIVHQAWLPMGCPRQEYWSWLPFPTPGDLPNPGIETASPASALYPLGNVHVCYAWPLSHVWLLATPQTAAHQAPTALDLLQK